MQKGCWQRRATFPGALKDWMGLWSENTLAGDRRTDKMASEIQPGPLGMVHPMASLCHSSSAHHLTIVTVSAFVSTAPVS